MDGVDDSYDHGHDYREASYAYADHQINASPVAQEESWEGDEEEYEEGGERLESEDEDDDGQDDQEHQGDEQDDYDASSDTSSAIYDPKTDPEGFAQRLDELAGVLEVSEQEAQALKWGPPIKRDEGGRLPWGHVSPRDFEQLVNHYLTSTDWKYIPTKGLGPPLGHRGDGAAPASAWAGIPHGMHPIRVVGRESQFDPLGIELSNEVELGSLGIEGLAPRP